MIKQWFVPITCAGLVACVGDDGEGTRDFDFLAMMANYSDEIVLPAMDDIAAGLDEIESSLGAYCENIDTAAEQQSLATARADYLALMGLWQRQEMMILGPIADEDRRIHNTIYSYGVVTLNDCAIDIGAAQLQAGEDISLPNRALNQRGLDTLEYLLFTEDLNHQCPSRIEATSGWNDLSESVRKAARCDYSQLVIADVQQSYAEVISAWEPTEGNFRSQFLAPNNLEDNLNSLSDGLFYLEVELKDTKLGTSLGIHADCSQLTCPEYIEAPFSHTSFAQISANLAGFRRAFMGGEGLGFDDLIIHEGFPSVVEKFIANLDQAEAIIDNAEGSLADYVASITTAEDKEACLNAASNPDTPSENPACNLHGVLTRMTNDLKSDFVTIVNLDLPDRVQSDND